MVSKLDRAVDIRGFSIYLLGGGRGARVLGKNCLKPVSSLICTGVSDDIVGESVGESDMRSTGVIIRGSVALATCIHLRQ